MKTNILVLALILSVVTVSAAFSNEGRPDFVEIKVTAISKQIVDGEIITKTLSKPSAMTFPGNEALIRVVQTFSTEVPTYEDMTKQTGEAGVIMSVTPNCTDSNILLNGVVKILKAPVLQSLDEQGSIAVQESYNVLFSLKVIENTPLEIAPIEMPDGSKLILSFLATIKPNKPLSPEELKRLTNSPNFYRID